MRRSVRHGYGVAVAALVVGAVVAVWLLTRGAAGALADLDPSPSAVAVPVSSAALDYAADASLSGVVGVGPEVLSTALAGMVTAVGAAPGAELGVGSMLYAVDGVPVVAYADDTVLFRSLRLGDQGPDVAAAQRLLAALLQTDVGDDGVFRASTDRAVRAYERRLGVAHPTGVLDPAWFSPLPTTPFVVSTVELQAGQPAPGAGEVVATATAAARSLTVTTGSAGPAGEYEFVTPGASVPVARAPDGTWEITDLPAAQRVVLAGEVTGTTASVSGRLRLVQGEPGQAVPGASIVTDAAGGTCVVLADGDLVRVAVVGSSTDGQARIRPVLAADAAVLLNPLVVRGDLTCPSS